MPKVNEGNEIVRAVQEEPGMLRKSPGCRVKYKGLQKAVLGIEADGQLYVLESTLALSDDALNRAVNALRKWREREGIPARTCRFHLGRRGGIYVRKPIPGHWSRGIIQGG